jgi:hypothetical protein
MAALPTIESIQLGRFVILSPFCHLFTPLLLPKVFLSLFIKKEASGEVEDGHLEIEF